jgi:hypothetical protein
VSLGFKRNFINLKILEAEKAAQKRAENCGVLDTTQKQVRSIVIDSDESCGETSSQENQPIEETEQTTPMEEDEEAMPLEMEQTQAEEQATPTKNNNDWLNQFATAFGDPKSRRIHQLEMELAAAKKYIVVAKDGWAATKKELKLAKEEIACLKKGIHLN